MATVFNILTDAPTLVSPNGGEVFTEGSIDIQWIEPLNIPDGETVWYEVSITDTFDTLKKPELIQISTIPYGNSSYSYYINKNLKGTSCRVGIRAVNQKGERSQISFSADNFTITNEELPSPSVLDPHSGGVYFSYIPIILQHDAVVGRCSQRAFYQIFYSSKLQGIDWTLLKSNIIVGSDPFDIDVRSIPTSSDYSLKIELVDDGHVSPPLFIDNITVNNISYFIIDTIPPKGSIKIIDNTEFVKNKDFIVQLEAYDKSSGIKEYRIEETDIRTDELIEGKYSDLTPLASWDIRTADDGVKLIKVKYKDYGDNIIQDVVGGKYFRTYKELDNKVITAFLKDGVNLYTAFEGDASDANLDNPLLYKDQSLIYTLEGNATALEYYNGVLYIAIQDPYENKGILQRESGSSVQSIVDNSNQYLDVEETELNSLYLSDSIINTMEVFDNKLFMGLQNGTLLSFNGATITVEHDTYVDIRSINLIRTDGNLLYIFFENSTEILIMYEDSSGNYIFTTVETGS
jgi:hypothetical protein